MTRKSLLWSVIAAGWCITLTGCMPKMSAEDMKNMRPARPAALDRLNMLLGTWETSADITVAGMDEPMKGTGTGTSTWESDGWVLVERSQFEMGEMGRMHGMAVWTWDEKAKVYRTFWADSMGESDVGTARYNEKTKTWHMKSSGSGPMGKSRGFGTAKVIDDKTMEWHWVERAGPFGMFKAMEMTGTSKKKG
jgi:hypothetical protein